MMTKKLDRSIVAHRERQAVEQAESVVERLALNKLPIDPVAVARTEWPLLKLCPGTYGNAFDGRLAFHHNKRFYCFYNTKYDLPGGPHAPRTRFSLAHELGHYFIEEHHAFLRRGGRPHPSQFNAAPFAPNVLMEKQANVFAANLLMPGRLFRPLANREEATMHLVYELAATFDTSPVSVACRVVQCTDFCTAAAVVRGGELAWVWPSEAMIQRGIYPKKGPLRSPAAARAWQLHSRGCDEFGEGSSCVSDWFETYNKTDKGRLPVTESYAAIPVANELLVLLTVPEDELLEHGDW